MDTAKDLALQKLIASISEYKASDLHLSVGVPPMLRVEGNLMPLGNESLVDINFISAIIESWLNDAQKEKLAKDKEITFAYQFKGKARIKVNIIAQQATYSISIKAVPEFARPFLELGFPQAVKEIIESEKGLVIITGAYNSGRSSTLTSIIDYLNQNYSKRIVTIEDPMEYIYLDNKSIIEQREVGRDVNTKAEGLNNLLTEDVDVVAVHSVEDPEVFQKVLNVASSGRLVVITTNNEGAIDTIKKFINSFPQEERSQLRENLSDTLSLIISQKIIPKVGGGEVLAYEVLIPNQGITSLIKEGDLSQIKNTMQTSPGEGMITMDQKLAELVNSGSIKQETAFKNTQNPTDLQTYLG
ncbi:MAG: PilT/PilU family type 4a pilus ATPase [Patescibacteria group bacterium]|nr:PilT/PilU family type 4a pilus ATPase [Patescibacteria group bacterium]